MDPTSQSYAVFFGLAGAASSLIFSCAGAAFGTYRSASGMAKASMPSSEKQTKDGTYVTLNGDTEVQFRYKNFVPVIMAGVLAIYGLIYSVISSSTVTAAGYTTSQGYSNFAGGLTVGLCCLVSGIAVGIIGEGGIIANTQNPKAFIPMILNLIYAEALGLYGLIFALIAVSLQF